MNQTETAKSDLPDGQAGCIRGNQGPPRIGWPGGRFVSGSGRAAIFPFHEATAAGVHAQGAPAQTAKFPDMLAAVSAKLRSTPGARASCQKRRKACLIPFSFSPMSARAQPY